MEQTKNNRSYDKPKVYSENIDLFAPTATDYSDNKKEKLSVPQTSVHPKQLELLLEN